MAGASTSMIAAGLATTTTTLGATLALDLSNPSDLDLSTSIAHQAEVIRRERNSRRKREKEMAEEEERVRRGKAVLEGEVRRVRRERGSGGQQLVPVDNRIVTAAPGTAEDGGMGSGVGVGMPERPPGEKENMMERAKAREEEQQVLVGNLIGEDHVNYVLMYNMLTGIRIAVSLLYPSLT